MRNSVPYRGMLAALCVHAAAFALLCPPRAHAQGLDRETTDAFQWVSGLGFPDVKDLKPVKVWTGAYSQGKTTQPILEYGFLSKEEAERFHIITTDLLPQTYIPSEPTVPDVRRVRFETVALDQMADLHLATNEGFRMWGRFNAPYPYPREEHFIMAWCCWRQGRDDLARRYVDACKSVQWPTATDQEQNANLRQLVTPGIAAYRFQITLSNFGNLAFSRSQLIDHLEAYLRHFPEAEDARRASQLARGLRELLAEEKDHPPGDRRDLSGLPKEEQARILVGRLRDLIQFEDKKTSPYFHLVELGEAAAPALIEGLDDYRPTRTVSFMQMGSRGLGPEQGRLSSISDLCFQILSLIAPHEFKHWPRGEASVYRPGPKQPSDLLLEAREWWAGRQKKGALQYMLDAIEAGGPEAKIQANELRLKFPDKAGAVFARYYRTLKHPVDRSNLIYSGYELRDPAWIKVLNQEVSIGKNPAIQTAAAFCLRHLGEEFSVEPLLKTWRQFPNDPKGSWEGSSDLVRFFASSVDEKLITELGRDFQKRSDHVKRQIISELVSASGPHNAWNQKKTASPEVRQLIEDMLISWLDDDREAWGMSRVGYTDPTIGDDAANGLASMHPEKYKFDHKNSFADRAAARLECRNQWRKAKDLPPIAAPLRPQLSDGEQNKIVAIDFADERLKDSATLASLTKLKGQNLPPVELARIICEFGTHLPKGVRGIKIRSVRDAKPHGFTLTVWTIAGKQPEVWQSRWWHAGVERNQERLLPGTSGTRGTQDVGKVEEWNGFVIAADKALSEPADAEVIIRIGLWAPEQTPP